jgi:DNA processing protein
LDALPRLAPGRQPPSVSDIERELARADKLGARLVASVEPDYPPLLAQLDPAPPVLCMRGRLDLPQKRVVAIVGARDASAAGLRLTEDFAR